MSDEHINKYKQVRKDLKLTREQASELAFKYHQGMSPERIERIENEKMEPLPSDVLALAEAYNQLELCNTHCTDECPIGKRFMPKIKLNTLEKITLEILSSLSSSEKKKDRLIEIASDGMISDDEIEDFIDIQDELNKILITVDTLKLWSEQMLANGSINKEKYEKIKNSKKCKNIGK